jgi:DDB1- and CUL4-associated factor 7
MSEKATSGEERAESSGSKKKEIYTYEAPWTVYSMSWRNSPEGRFQIALGSFIEEYANQFHIVQLKRDEDGTFVKLSQFDHPYPATKVSWAPAKLALGASSTKVDLLATSGDYLRLWNVAPDYTISMRGVLNNNKHTGKVPMQSI